MSEVLLSPFLPRSLPSEIPSSVGGTDWCVEDLFPSEAEIVVRAVPSRRREFATDRILARGLLTRLGCDPAPMLCAVDRSPSWPRGIIGTFTHTEGACAVAALRSGGEGLGIESILSGRSGSRRGLRNTS